VQRYYFFEKYTNKKLGKNLGFCFFRHKTPQKGKKQKNQEEHDKAEKTPTHLHISKKITTFAVDL
jgi:hypothetical protein